MTTTTEVLPVVAEETGAIQLLLNLENAGALSPVSLDLDDPGLTYERWESLGRFFGRINRSVTWWLGDWINHGIKVLGDDEALHAVEDTRRERYDEALQVTGLAKKTLVNISSVCERIARSRRRENLPFAIHAEVAYLDPEQQAHWLDQAEEHGYSAVELRRAIKGEDAEDDEPLDGAVGGGRMTVGERLEEVARLIWNTAQKTTNGEYLISGEVIAQLGAALGEGD